MPLEDFAREMTLKCGKPKMILTIMLQDKAHKTIAQPANAVVKNDGI
jgi:hypothetical protein